MVEVMGATVAHPRNSRLDPLVRMTTGRSLPVV
jgi:hypothetical protein